MENTVLIGRGRELSTVPESQWLEQLTAAPDHGQPRLRFMTEAHRRVRQFVVGELPRQGRTLGPEYISRKLELPLDAVTDLLTDLDQKLFFLVRDEAGAVSWAFPVTVEPTPHRLRFSTGERLYGA